MLLFCFYNFPLYFGCVSIIKFYSFYYEWWSQTSCYMYIENVDPRHRWACNLSHFMTKTLCPIRDISTCPNTLVFGCWGNYLHTFIPTVSNKTHFQDFSAKCILHKLSAVCSKILPTNWQHKLDEFEVVSVLCYTYLWIYKYVVRH